MFDLLRYIASLGFMRQRGLIVCQCDREKAFDYLAQIADRFAVAALTANEKVTAFDTQHIKLFSSQTLRTQLLGDEFDVVLIDVAAGLPPDGLALMTGALRGGGVCIMLIEAFDRWPQVACADYARMLPYPFVPQDSSCRFLQHAKQVLSALINDEQALLLCDLPRQIVRHRNSISSASTWVANSWQRELIRELCHHSGIGLITGPRGAGKSSALGLLADALIAQGRSVVLLAISAAGKSAVQRAASLPLATQTLEQLLMLPVETGEQFSNRVLLIDESAALPAAVIEALCARFATVFMASTTEGYEGSGQALSLKLIKRWRERADFKHIELEHSLRFTAPDPVSHFLDRALLLNAEPAMTAAAPSLAFDWRYLTQDALVADKSLLAEVYGLLRAAHYRTTPDDLRVLLDGVDTHCAVLMQGRAVVAVCLFVIEGGLDRAISADIAAGHRRPRGHLLVQSMAQHLGESDLLQQRVARVMRIAVAEPLRRQGLARRCLQGVERWLCKREVRWIGSSFSASNEAMGFWLAQGYQLQRMGHRRHPASGELSALVLKALN